MARDRDWYVEEAQDLLDTYRVLRRDQEKLDNIANLERPPMLSRLALAFLRFWTKS